MHILAITNVAFFGTDAADADKTKNKADKSAVPNALLCRDGRIVHIDTTAKILELLDQVCAEAKQSLQESGAEDDRVHSVIVDGKHYAINGIPPLLAPSFIDAHAHVLDGGGRLTYIADLSRTMSKAALQAALRATISEDGLETGDWLFGSGWDDEIIGAEPDAAWLDEVDATIPMCLYRCDFHTAAVNSAALKAAGITKDTPSPPGGLIKKDPETGEPTGILRESAVNMVRQHFPFTSQKRLWTALDAATKRFHRFGITSVHDMSTMDRHSNPVEFLFFRSMLEQGKLKLRLRTSCRAGEIEEARTKGLLPGQEQPHDTAMLRLHFCKMFTDGSLGSRTARMSQPYAPRVSECCGTYTERKKNGSGEDRRHGVVKGCQCGIWVTKYDDLQSGVRDARDVGLMPALHAIGDAAVSGAIDALMQPLTSSGEQEQQPASGPAASGGIRGRIEHCQHVLHKDLQRLAGSGIVASIQPMHMASDAVVSERVLGQWRRHGAFPLATMQRQLKVKMAFGSDWPVVTQSPGMALFAATTRRSHWGEAEITRVATSDVPSADTVWEPRQCLSLREALEAYTVRAAESSGDAELLGRLRPGFAADFVLLAPAVTALLTKTDDALGDDPAADALNDPSIILKTFLAGDCVFSSRSN